jgi:AmmeMemoRadiSam system protein B
MHGNRSLSHSFLSHRCLPPDAGPNRHTTAKNNSSRIFLLGPSHHVYSRRCYLSTADEYSTPLGPLKIDRAVVDDLRASGQFDDMPLRVDEAEHSLELHTSFIASVMRGREFTLVPIMIGALSPER